MEAGEPESAAPAPAPADSWQAWIRPAAPPLAGVKIRIPRFCHVDILVFIGLIGLTWYLYLPDLQLGFFTLDDSNYVLVNRQIEALSGENIWKMWTQPYFANYSPMHLMSYAFDYAVGKDDPGVYHASSNLWAGVVAGFVYLFALLLMQDRWIAVAAGVLFAAHPVHVEAVAWISSRKDLVAAAFALPAMICYLFYSNRGKRQWLWYAASLILFLLAIAGKQSVAVVPVQLFFFDLLARGRLNWRIVLDKLPYVVMVAYFAIRTMAAQPHAGHDIDIYVISRAICDSLWLLTGFADYVIYRFRPPSEVLLAVKAFFWLLPAIVVALIALPRKYNVTMPLLLVYWVIQGLLPAQALALVHPVSDRYAFFPSVALVILIAWAVVTLGRRFRSAGIAAGTIVLVVIAAMWAQNTRAYLAEWNDPRSIWHAAAQKSGEINNLHYLGSRYQLVAMNVAGLYRIGRRPSEDSFAFARVHWANDPRLENLLTEWDTENRVASVSREFVIELREFAWQQYEAALEVLNTRVDPNLFFRRGNLRVTRGEYEAARQEFARAWVHGRLIKLQSHKRYVEIQYHYSIGQAYISEGRYHDSLPWMQNAEKLQKSYGITVIANLPALVRNWERIAASKPPSDPGP